MKNVLKSPLSLALLVVFILIFQIFIIFYWLLFIHVEPIPFAFRNHINNDFSTLPFSEGINVEVGDCQLNSNSAEQVVNRLETFQSFHAEEESNFLLELIKLKTTSNRTAENAHIELRNISDVVLILDGIKHDQKAIAQQLCLRSFKMDLDVLKYLLFVLKVDPNLKYEAESNKNAFHCLANIYVMMDARVKSQVYSFLNGQESYLSKLFYPSLETNQTSVLSRDVIEHLSIQIVKTAKLLHYANVPYDEQDSSGNTPLHYASIGGALELTRYLLLADADINAQNHEGRTPLHYAAAYGHCELGALLVKHGAKMDVMDVHNTTPMDIVKHPGSTTAKDASIYFNLTQNPARNIARLNHPELQNFTLKDVNTRKYLVAWPHGTGGWNPRRLAGFEDDMNCEIDQYWEDEIDGDQLFHQYIARNSPVLIRGLIHDWQLANEFKYDKLLQTFGDVSVMTSIIPYSTLFNAEAGKMMKFKYFMKELRNHAIFGNEYPWYVFRSHLIPQHSEANHSFVQYKFCPNPNMITNAFHYYKPSDNVDGINARKLFCNAQCAIGGAGTGAAIHYHYTAWSALIYGAKKWLLYPPHNMIMSKGHIKEFYHHEMKDLMEKRQVKPLTCVQTAGDVIIVPEQWGHGVLNLQESISVATESKRSLWRLQPETTLLKQSPAFVPRWQKDN